MSNNDVYIITNVTRKSRTVNRIKPVLKNIINPYTLMVGGAVVLGIATADK